MFERFTDRARRVLVVSEIEARDLGHPFIRPEHLFLGLLQAGGVAARVLDGHGVELEGAREAFAASIASSEEATRAVKVPFSPSAKKALELSLREALQLGHNYIGTEHLLLALVRQSEGNAWLAQVTGVTPSVLRSEVQGLLSGAAAEDRRSPAVTQATARASGLAGQGLLTTGQLLSSMLEDDRCQASRALVGLGVTKAAVDEALAQVPIEETSDAAAEPPRVELRLGETTVSVDDPAVAGALLDLTPAEVHQLLQRAVGVGQRRRRRGPRAS